MKIKAALWMGLLAGAFGVVSAGASFADSQKVVDVNTVRSEIARAHADWRAKESWVTRLSKDELHRLLGLKNLPQGNLDYQPLHSMDSAPAVWDWRNVNGVNWLGAVMNQGNCGSCVAFSTVATLEAQTSIAAGVPWLRPSFSPQALFACGNAKCETGWLPDDAADFLKNTGIPDEACMPYTSGSTGQDVACSQKCADADSRAMKIASYSSPTSYGGDVETVKAALKKGPLVTTLMVYYDFIAYAGGVYKHVAGDIAGGHAVSLVGYDDTKRAWLIRNSWGQEWGENGFGWVSWDDISGVGANTWAYEIPGSTDYVSVTSPTDREYVTGTYNLQATATGARATSLQFVLKDTQGRDIRSVGCNDKGNGACAGSVDTSTLKEGRYEIYAQSSANPSVKSQVREFYVINSEPKATISFAAAPGTDLTAPLTERPEFIVSVKASPVPMQHIEFRALDKDGKVVAIKGNDRVLDQMKMGWRVVTVPNGQYTILFHGETHYNGKVYAVDSSSLSVTVNHK